MPFLFRYSLPGTGKGHFSKKMLLIDEKEQNVVAGWRRALSPGVLAGPIPPRREPSRRTRDWPQAERYLRPTQHGVKDCSRLRDCGSWVHILDVGETVLYAARRPQGHRDQWAIGVGPPSFILPRIGASGMAAREISISAQKHP